MRLSTLTVRDRAELFSQNRLTPFRLHRPPAQRGIQVAFSGCPPHTPPMAGNTLKSPGSTPRAVQGDFVFCQRQNYARPEAMRPKIPNHKPVITTSPPTSGAKSLQNNYLGQKHDKEFGFARPILPQYDCSA